MLNLCISHKKNKNNVEKNKIVNFYKFSKKFDKRQKMCYTVKDDNLKRETKGFYHGFQKNRETGF